MLKPICVPCRRFFRIVKTGFYFTEMMPLPGHRRPPPGTKRPDLWTPYKVWSGDLWECEGCGAHIVSGTGRAPIVEHYQPDFVQKVINFGADQLEVNDC